MQVFEFSKQFVVFLKYFEQVYIDQPGKLYKQIAYNASDRCVVFCKLSNRRSRKRAVNYNTVCCFVLFFPS